MLHGAFTDRQLVNFESHYTPEPNSGCWIWTGYANSDGYGKCNINQKAQNAHRVSYTIHKEDIPSGTLVLHKCDNPACVNPAHLELGSDADNARHKSRRRRFNLKISDQDVLDIRNLDGNYEEISRMYGISKAYVSRIKNMNSRIYAGENHVIR